MDTFPDLGALSDEELKDMIQELTEEEQDVSYRRRILHGKIDILPWRIRRRGVKCGATRENDGGTYRRLEMGRTWGKEEGTV